MRHRRLLAIGLFAALVAPVHLATVGGARAEERSGPVTPDPAFVDGVPGGECTPESEYERHVFGSTPRFGPECKRIRFAFGPIVVKPGQNEAMIQPVTIEKPAYDGYIVRFKPDLVRAVDGSKPRTEDVHLHHATWLSLNREYGSGPFFAAGEEKTVATFPTGYGLEVRSDDMWGLLYMVHNALASTETVWITYDIDFVPKATAERMGIRGVKTLWLDVQSKPIAPGAPSSGANPVFNVQQGFGHVDPETRTRVCTWPRENCARFDQYGNVTPQQGVPTKVGGQDWVVPKHMAGTIIGLGGHLHPGGIRNEVSVVRGNVEKPVFLSDAIYWDHEDPRKAGGPPHSWNMSMGITGLPLGWGVKIKPGDKVRINAVYDSETASWYENMGIVVALVAPDPHPGDEGVDVFTDRVVLDRGVSARALVPEGPWHMSGFRPSTCTPDLKGASGTKRLCMRGTVTHGAVAESTNTGDPCKEGRCPALPKKAGPLVTDIYSAAFTYGNADIGVIGQTGIPRIKKGTMARFWNVDTVARIWHTFTRCELPCTGPTTVNYPVANGDGSPMDFDSMELGFGMLWEPSKSQIGGNDPYDANWVKDATYWEFTPTKTGTFSFYCRIHPGMRGAFEVVE